MSAQSLRGYYSEREAEADEQYREAIAERAKQIASQIRADIIIPITPAFLADCPPEQRAGLETRKLHAFGAWDWLIDSLVALGERERMLMQKRIGRGYGAALAEELEKMQNDAIDAYARQAASNEIDAEIKAASNDEQ